AQRPAREPLDGPPLTRPAEPFILGIDVGLRRGQRADPRDRRRRRGGGCARLRGPSLVQGQEVVAELARGTISDRPSGRTIRTLGLRGLTGPGTVAADGKRYYIAFQGGAVVAAASPLA